MKIYVSKADAGLYYYREVPGGLGRSCGGVTKVRKPGTHASFYSGLYTLGGRWIALEDRGTPKSFMERFEAVVRESVPDVEFIHEGF